MASSTGFGLTNVQANVWPRRLLRVKDMTSYECQMVNDDAFYRKKDKNPEYAIISYTWGRYRADGKHGSPQNPKAEAITLKGITWDIPGIDPVQGFSKNKFKNVLQVVADGYDYVWVDVACIDQDADVDGEIGRQAAIFRRASASYIWLHQQAKKDDDMDLASRVANLTDCVRKWQREGMQQQWRGNVEARHQHEAATLGLLLDPWFSSLWTLQESFLRKDATILTRTGASTTIDWQGQRVELTLNVLVDICKAYLEIENGPASYEVKQAINEAGLWNLAAQNPLVLLRAARHRQYSINRDRILGIQQIFGVALGTTELGQSQLEKALSIAINQKCPALAQLFFHAYQQDSKPSWQVYFGTYTQGKIFRTDPAPSNPRSRVPVHRGRVNGRTAGIEDTMYVPADFFNAQEITGQSQRPQMWGDIDQDFLKFRGVSLPLEALWDYWQMSERARMSPGLERGEIEGPTCSPTPEEVPYQNSFTCSFYEDTGECSTMPPDFRQFTRPLSAIYRLCSQWPRQIKVLVLGTIQESSVRDAAQAVVGMLVKRAASSDCWRRIGVCTFTQGPQMVRDECWLA